jgi:uncharacterized protein YeaO (DUF488 family)
MIQLKRAYERPSRGDGYRVLVDRLWPRGLTKTAARVDLWAKDLAPSTELRRWYGHEPAKWTEFRRRYARELKGRAALLDELRARAGDGALTLVYSSKETERNNAAALRELLERGR